MNRVIRVAVNVPRPLLFDYRVGDDLGDIFLGSIVRVPFGRQEKLAVVVEYDDSIEAFKEDLRFVLSVLPYQPLSVDWLLWIRFVADYYQAPLGFTLHSVLPPFGKARQSVFERVWCVTEQGRQVDVAHLPKRASRQRALLSAFQSQGQLTRTAIEKIVAHSAALLRQFVEAAWIVSMDVSRLGESAHLDAAVMTEKYTLNEQQIRAINHMTVARGFSVYLLEGVTGSGKTEVYLHVIAQALARQQQVMVLVPEIHLTPQFTQTLSERFPYARLIALNSTMSDGQRLRGWTLAQSGQVDIVLGTRLSLFTPLPNLGLIVVDEEHDASYKQQDGIRYSARDLAIWRAQQLNIPIILGSATPSLESLQQVRRGHYQHLHLTHRAAAQSLPTIHIADTRQEKLSDGLSEALCLMLSHRLEMGEQSLVFINRRGYAPVLSCPSCGWVCQCRHCSARLVFHLRNQSLRCHYCGYAQRVMSACPACGEQDLRALGRGTQRLEDALKARFPHARILRVDRDTTRQKDAFKEMLTTIHSGEVDILVGTQMLAKGHHFDRLTFVAIVDADTSLFAPDFRASERLFSTLLQVAGRAGRGALAGDVFIQTDYPTHPLYSALVRHDYPGFSDQLLQERQEAHLPPFMHQTILRVEADTLEMALSFLQAAKNIAIVSEHPHVLLFDPVPMLLVRKAGRARAQLLIEAAARPALQGFLRVWVPMLYGVAKRSISWHVDVDPIEVT